jgi:hypothetical protein
MPRTPKQKAAGKALANEEIQLHQAIGEFIFWFSQLEFTIKARLAAALGLDDDFFDIIIGPYDFAMLCTVTEQTLSKDQSPEDQKNIKAYFNKCHKLNQSVRIVVAHGTWTLGGARHMSRQTLQAKIHFPTPDELRKHTTTARNLMSSIL